MAAAQASRPDAQTHTVTDMTPTKRKHDDTTSMNGTHLLQQQSDILEVLRQYDTVPSFLDHKFTYPPKSEHTIKRVKVSAGIATTISEKLANNQYSSLEDLASDAIRVNDTIAASLRQDEGEEKQPSIETLKQIQRAKSMRQVIEELVVRESHETATSLAKEENGTTQVKAEAQGDSGTILTLFGHAPTAKQLFSSLQNDHTSLNVEELSLPNGISTTKIKPSSTLPQEKVPLFSEAFAPSASLPPLSAPKSYKRPNTRDGTIKWEFKDNTRNSKRGGYTTATLTIGDWLSYGRGAKLSPYEKRKQRERALSDAEAPQADTSVELEKQEDALFQQAYSSYAPAHDNSRSLVDTSLKSLVWWHKIGSKKYDSRFGSDLSLIEQEYAVSPTKEETGDDGGFEQAVQDYIEPEELIDEGANKEQQQQDPSHGDMRETLEKINALLETLAGLQWIRNATPSASTSTSKLPISPAPVMTSRSDQADEPSKAEFKAYHELQREIVALILTLPPYAVAKLNGDQLADLGVSKVLTFQTSNYRGQMEEDPAAKMARSQAMAIADAASRSAPATNPHYSSTSRAPAIGQSANTRYGQVAFGTRTPSTAPANPQRPMTGQNYNTPTAQAQFSGQYARSGPTQQSFAQPNGQQYQQRPPAAGYGYNGGYQNQPPPRINYSAAQGVPPFQPRSQTAATNAVNYQSTSNAAPTASMSPGKTAQPGSGRDTPVNFASPAQTPVNGFQSARAPPPLIARASSGTPQPQAQQMTNGHV